MRNASINPVETLNNREADQESNFTPVALSESTGPGGQANNSYSSILRSTSLIGGSQFFTIIIQMVRTKCVAILLGPAGVGLAGLFGASVQLLSVVAGLGIRTSGVKHVAQAHASNDRQEIAKTVITLRRLCWGTSLAGAALTCLLATSLSNWTFGTDEYESHIAFLGIMVLLNQLIVGQNVILQGTRRIKELAIQSVVGMSLATLSALTLYWALGIDGIIPAMIAGAAIRLTVAWHFARRIKLEAIEVSMKESVSEGKGFILLGAAFMYSGLLESGVLWGTRAIIQHKFDLAAVGVYTAAWGLSGQFAKFILKAMGSDFLPRLSGQTDNPKEMTRLINEQIEVGTLLAMPGLILTLVLAPWLILAFLSSQFTLSTELLPWFVVGIFIRVISWPVGFTQVAMGAGRIYVCTQTLAHGLHIGLMILLIDRFGLPGCAMAFATMYLIMFGVIRCVASHLIRFQWSSESLRVILGSAATVVATFLIEQFAPSGMALAIGMTIFLLTTAFCVRSLSRRLPSSHRLNRLLGRLNLSAAGIEA